MFTQSMSNPTLYQHTCGLRKRQCASFTQQRAHRHPERQRQPQLCVRARLEPSEASESIGMLCALQQQVVYVTACDSNQTGIEFRICAESSREQEALLVSQSATESDRTALQSFLYPDASELSNSEMPIWDHLDELRERILIAALAAAGAILACFCFSKDLVVFLEAPVAAQGVRFLQLSPGEFFFTTFKVREA